MWLFLLVTANVLLLRNLPENRQSNATIVIATKMERICPQTKKDERCDLATEVAYNRVVPSSVAANVEIKMSPLSGIRIVSLTALLAVVVSLLFASTAQAQRKERLKARIVVAIPRGANPPAEYEERMRSVATRTEKFVAQWMEHWGREIERAEFFERDSEGNVIITLVEIRLKGKPAGHESLMEVRKLAINGAKTKLELTQRSNVLWWIFHEYPGVKGFRGGGNSKYGSAINAYPGGRGLINQEADLASQAMNGTQIKGAIHEFGHALGLPHSGPKMELKIGNSLMGPISPKYFKKTSSKDGRVHLNEACAAQLWRHPIFRTERPPMPAQPKKFELKDWKAEEDDEGQIVITGKLDSNRIAHSVIAYDSKNQDKSKVHSDYWVRSYTGKVEEDGSFTLVIAKPRDQANLFLKFCLMNGINTGDGKSQKKSSYLRIGYSGKRGNRKFVLPK